jgi:NAD(P)H-dependent FMN reductase
MKLAIISGSSRPNAQSLKVAKWIEAKLKSDSSYKELSLTDLNNLNLTLNPNEFWEGASFEAKEMASIYSRFEEADAFIIITPEWGGGVPPALRQLILMSGTSMSHKPVLTIGVSATPVGGIRPVEELKHATKNTRFVIVPDPVVITSVEQVFNKEPATDSNLEHEQYLTTKLNYSLKVLEEYAKALQQVRNSGVIDYKDFAFGM